MCGDVPSDLSGLDTPALSLPLEVQEAFNFRTVRGAENLEIILNPIAVMVVLLASPHWTLQRDFNALVLQSRKERYQLLLENRVVGTADCD